MASGVRTRKATSTPELDIASLNNVERLIFAQAVHEFGSGAWQEVAKLLSKHPMISQPKGVFTAQVSCSTLYKHMMEEANLEWSETETAPRLERHLRLAQKHYVVRVTELRQLIAAEETRFKQLVTEIDQIRSGAWDDKIRASLGVQTPPHNVEETVPPSPEPQIHEPEPADSDVEIVEVVEADVPVESVPEEEVTEDVPAPEEPITSPVEAPIEAPIPPDVDEKEEGSDNEAVNELIGHYESDKPSGDAQEDVPASPVEPPAEAPAPVLEAQEEEEEMQVDEGPVKQEEEEPAESLIETPVREASNVPEEEAEEEEEQGVEEAQEAPSPDTQERESSTRTEGKRKASDAESPTMESLREKKRLREESEPMEEDEGVPRLRRKERAGDKRFQNMIGMLHSQISQHRYGNIFHNPIKKSEAPDYHDIVKRPMDLKTIKSRVKDGLISNSLEFQRDIFLMFANAMMYNRPGSEIYNMAEEMMTSSEREINAFRQTEGFHRM